MDGLDFNATSSSASQTRDNQTCDQPSAGTHPAWAQALAEASAGQSGVSHPNSGDGDNTAHAAPTAPSATATDNAGSANGLISAATDPKTGKVDTNHLAQQVADAAAHDPAKANAAYAALHDQLQKSDPKAAEQFSQDVVRAFGDVSKGSAPGVYRAGGEVLKANPILTKQWEFTKSAWTGEGGPTKGLNTLLQQHGIERGRVIGTPPAGSLDRASGVDPARANNTNGSLARDAIADRYRAQGLDVRTEVNSQGGARRVDVQVQKLAADPRYNGTLEIESKVGRPGLDSDTRLQVAKDAHALAENGEIRGAGHTLEGAGKVLGPVAVVADAVQLGQAFHQDGNTIGKNTGRAAAGVAGGWGGALAGAEAGGAAGAALGSVVPVVGTAVGGAVGAIAGGIVGGLGGDWVGRRLFDEASSIF